jgi:hypothetical protein
MRRVPPIFEPATPSTSPVAIAPSAKLAHEQAYQHHGQENEHDHRNENMCYPSRP